MYKITVNRDLGGVINDDGVAAQGTCHLVPAVFGCKIVDALLPTVRPSTLVAITLGKGMVHSFLG